MNYALDEQGVPLDDKDNNLQGMFPKTFKSIYAWLPYHVAYFLMQRKPI
jgi:hypothetical protein